MNSVTEIKLKLGWYLAISGSLADLLEDGLVRNLAEVGSLDLGVDAGQSAAECIFGGRVDHLGLHGSVVR